ncbi:MAG: hypothetical protein WBI44_04945 [Syntrophaceticus sp.]
MGQEQDLENRDVSIFSLMAQTLQKIDEKQADLPGTITVLSLFTLLSILNLAQEQVVKGTVAGGKDVLGMLTGMLAQGQKPGPEMLASLLQKSGKKTTPQMLDTLLSLAGETAQKEEKPDSPERRSGRGR